MISDKLYEQIEKYSNDEMTSEEKKDFEILLNSDSKLQKVLQVYQELPNVLQHVKADQAFRQQVAEVRQSYEDTSSSNTFKFPTLAILLFLLTIIVGGFFLWKSNNTTQLSAEEQIFAYWNDNDKPTLDIQRNTTNLSEGSKIYKSAFDLFNAQNYDSTIVILNRINSVDSVYLTALKLEGYAQYKMGNYRAATLCFQTYLSNNKSEEKDIVLWYQAFTYLKNSQRDLAKVSFQAIIDQDYSKAAASKKILDLLKDM